MAKKPEEWLKQADYDFETAGTLFKGGRYIYAVFMCHLSIEKALKGLYRKKTGVEPPKIHDLFFLLGSTVPDPPDDMRGFIQDLSRASVPTRYPDDLDRMKKHYTKEVTRDVMKHTGEVLEWLRKMY